MYLNQYIKTGLCYCIPLLLFACKKTNSPTAQTTDTTVVTPPLTMPVTFKVPSYNPSGLDTTFNFNPLPLTSSLANTTLLEISGIAASKINKGIVYIHNDGGNPSRIELTDVTGANRGTLNLGVVNRDWEDIAVGPGPISGQSYVYVANIGDNDSKYSSVFVYRFPEPDLKGQTANFTADISAVDVIELKYPDGPRNAETLMIDPASKDLYIASKETNRTKIYVAPYPQATNSVTVLSPIVQLLFNKATGGDISPDGTEILLRSNDQIWYWKLGAGTTIAAGLFTKPFIAPYANNEPQGEGIGFAADGSGYYTNTEIKGYPGKLATTSFYRRK